jgi:Rhamnan synthesis protein F/Tetratricopeptide repeat
MSAFRLPRRKPSIITLADRARDAGQWELAAQLYRKALNRNPRNSPICVQYGHALKESGLEGAERAYREAIACEPGNGDAHLQLGHVQKMQGKTEEAQGSYLRAFVLGALPYALEELNGLGWSETRLAELRRLHGNGSLQPISPGVVVNDEPLITDHAQKNGQPVVTPDWSGRFDANWYLEQNPDVAQVGMDPLEHFLTYGLREGRKPNASAARGSSTAVTEAEIHCLKKPQLGDEVALFVTHSPRGRLKPHVPHYLEALRRHGITVVLIVATDKQFTELNPDLMKVTDGIFVRSNKGYDFAAWAHLLRLHPELFDSQILYLLNDSVVGPTNDVAFRCLLSKLRESAADVIGLTENFERGPHLQSYFLALKRRALSSTVLHKFVSEIVSYEDKRDVINELEIRLAPTLKAGGLVCEPVFPAKDYRNPTIYHWKLLLESGVPFVKVETIRGLVPDLDIRDWREILAAQGYDVSLAQRTLDDEKEASLLDYSSTPTANLSYLSAARLPRFGTPGGGFDPVSISAAEMRKLRARIEAAGLFDPQLYLSLNDDVRGARMDAWDHFLTHGLYEGRHFTNTDLVARLLVRMDKELKGARDRYVAAANQALARADCSKIAALFRKKGIRIGVYCSSQGNFYMHEIADLFVWGLKSEQIDAVLRNEMASIDESFSLRVFVAPHEFFTLGQGKAWAPLASAPNSVLYNVEQVQTPWFCRAFPLLLQAPLVLDLNFQSAEILRRAACNVLHFVPGYASKAPYAKPYVDASDIELLTGYAFAKQPHNWREQDNLDDRPIDVLFIGNRAPRRDKALAYLQHLAETFRFLCVYARNDVPLTVRNYSHASCEIGCALGQRAKIVLNIHRDWLGYFEWSRIVLQGVWQGACVVSDPGLPTPIFDTGVHYLEEDVRHIGELTRWLLETKEGREKLDATRMAGYERAVRLGSMQVSLAPVLDAFKRLLAC